MSARRRDIKKKVRRVYARRVPVPRSPARTSRSVTPTLTHEEVGF